MGKFILGVIITLLVLILCALGFAMLGFFPTPANVPPPRWEHRLANSAVDASMEKHAPRLTNPIPPNDQNLEEGMKLYSMNCALCHGDLDRKPASLANSFYPPAPNLVSDPPDDPEWHLYYTIRTGVRYTGITHPGLFGTAPSADLLAEWSETAVQCWHVVPLGRVKRMEAQHAGRVGASV